MVDYKAGNLNGQLKDLQSQGQSAEVVFPTARLRKGGAYTFFCSFPGHISMMKGTIAVK